MTKISLLCPSNRPTDLKKWLDSLYENCDNPADIELSLTVEEYPDNLYRWGNCQITKVVPKQYAINELVEICYKQSNSPYIFLSGDDTICRTRGWDTIFLEELSKYPDNVALIYPNDLIFGKKLACYPVTSRLVMDKVPFPLPFKRYAIDDTIFDIVPRNRRIYLPDVIMEHLHLVDTPTHGVKVIRNGETKYYPTNQEVMEQERPIYNAMLPTRLKIREELGKIAGLAARVMVCLPTAEMARKANFYDNFLNFTRPEGTLLTLVHSQSPARNRNVAIDKAIENDCTHILFIDDDIIFPTDTLLKLLEDEKDIVSGLYLMRNHPHQPIAFDRVDDTGKCGFLSLANYPDQDLIPVKATGLGCMLVKIDVFKKLEKPYIRLGELEPDMWCDDLGFLKRCREAGFEIWLDTTILCGHQASVTIWPVKNDQGEFRIAYDTTGDQMVTA